MKPLPALIQQQFKQILLQHNIEVALHLNYNKWLRFYWDFCNKYQHKINLQSSLPLFINKLRSKNQFETVCQQAEKAVQLFYQIPRVVNGNKITALFTQYFKDLPFLGA